MLLCYAVCKCRFKKSYWEQREVCDSSDWEKNMECENDLF